LPIESKGDSIVQMPFDLFEEVIFPWDKRPHELVSLLDMIDFQAWNFFWCGYKLQSIKQDCLVGSIPVDGDTPIFDLNRPLDDKARDKALGSLTRIATEFSAIGLRITAETTVELATKVEKREAPQNFQWLMDQVDGIQGLSKKEIAGKAFFYVPAERIKFFPKMSNPHIFGKPVGDAFPSATYDIAESGVCLALDRGTGCVFHLMRVLEIGLTSLGTKFGVSLAHTNWGPAIEEIESKIREMHKDPVWKALPDCKQQQEFYAQAASHFGILKDAWRNYTMHVRGFYTEERSERIFENVKGFMQKLAERLSE
jgi:hypothetical protein